MEGGGVTSEFVLLLGLMDGMDGIVRGSRQDGAGGR
jgi:hypothetical protein